MQGKILIGTQGIQVGGSQKPCFVDWTMVHRLEEAVLLFGNLGIKHTNEAVVSSTEKEVVPGWVEVECGDLVVDFRVLPAHSQLSAIPAMVSECLVLSGNTDRGDSPYRHDRLTPNSHVVTSAG